MERLRFNRGKENAKLAVLVKKLSKRHKRDFKEVYTFSLLSGHSCPFAHICLTKVVRENGKSRIEKGKHATLNCFSAMAEVIYPNVYDSRKHNFDLLRASDDMVELIDRSLPRALKTSGGVLRIHVGGDFFNQTYFDAWLAIAKKYPQSVFYGYTKSLPYLVKRINDIPNNFRITASKGGRADKLIDTYNLTSATIVFSETEAKEKGLKLDHDDSTALDHKVDFALMIHGIQPAGSQASKAKHAHYGRGGYSRDN